MNSLVEAINAAIAQDELWALAASAPHHGGGPTVPGGIHWTWATGDNWEHCEPEPLEEFIGEAEDSCDVSLVTREEWSYDWSGDRTSPGQVFGSVEEVRTADAAQIIRNDPATTLRRVAAHRDILTAYSKYRSKLDETPEDEEQRWHTTGQGYVWHHVICGLADYYAIARPS